MHIKRLLRLASILVLVGCAFRVLPEGILTVGIAHAQVPNEPLTSALSLITVTVNLLITMLNVLAWIVLKLLSSLLNPALIFDMGNGSVLMTTLNGLWILVRNLVNIVFAFVLVAGAVIMTVTGSTEKIKGAIPKFVLALVLVNFSWFIPRVVLDVSNVLTQAVYQIPAIVQQDTCNVPVYNGNQIVGFKACEVVNDIWFFNDTTNTQFGQNGDFFCIPGIICVSFVPYTNPGLTTQNKLLSGLVVNIMGLRNLMNITSINNGNAVDPGVIVAYIIQMALVLIIHVALVFPLLAMVFVFVVRIPVLWLTIAGMPLVALSFILGGKLGQFDPMEKIWKTFLSTAFMPALAGVPLVVGFIVLKAGLQIDPTTIPGLAGLRNVNFPLYSGMGTLASLLWQFIGLGIMWAGVFMVLKQDKFTSSFVGAIEGFGKNIGSIALKLPLAAPILPAPRGGGESMSALQMLKVPAQLKQQMDMTGRIGLPHGGKPMETQVADALKKSSINTSVRGQLDIVVNEGRTTGERQTAMREAARLMREDFTRQNSPLKNLTDEQLLKGAGVAHNLQDKLDAAVKKINAPPAAPAPTPTT